MLRFTSWIVVGTIAVTATAHAAPVRIGELTLDIPNPPSTDTQLSQSNPEMISLMQGYLGANRLVEVYLLRTDLDNMKTDGLNAYCQLQVSSQLESKVISEREFERHQGEFEAATATLFQGDAFETHSRNAIDKGNKQLQKTTGTDASVSVQKPKYFGVYDRQPWGLFYSMQMPMQVKESNTVESSTQGVASGMVNASGKLASLNCYRTIKNAKDLDLVRAQTREWATAVNLANPAPSGNSYVLGGFDWSRVVMYGVLGGLAGLLLKIFGGKKKS